MARTLSEVYAGMLSRDWPRLLEILQSGEHRAVLMTRGGDRFADTGDYGDAQNATSCIEFLKREGAWWLPAPGDIPQIASEDDYTVIWDGNMVSVNDLTVGYFKNRDYFSYGHALGLGWTDADTTDDEHRKIEAERMALKWYKDHKEELV